MLTVWQLDAAQTTPYYNLALCSALAAAGCNPVYWTSPYLYESTLPVRDGVQVEYAYPLPVNRGLLLRSRWVRRAVRAITYPLGHVRIHRRANAQPPDILHVQWARFPLLDRRLMRQMRALHIPVVYTAHDVVPLFARKAVHTYGAIYALTDRIIVHTRAAYDDFRRTFPNIPADKLRVIPLIAADERTTPYANRQEARRAARQSLHIDDDAPVMLFFGTMRPYKGLTLLVEAYQRARQSNPSLRLLVAGRGETPADAAPLDAIRDDPNVIIESLFIPSGDLWRYFCAADAAVFPYRRIYQSAALIDAMGYACPVIVTDVGGLAETVDGNGWVVPPDDPERLAAAMLEACADRARLDAMGEQSRRLYERLYNPAVVAAQTIALYEELCHP